jgi:hypothetical protein
MILAILVLTAAGRTQPPDTLWTQTYGGYNQDKAYSVQQTTDGGYIIAGATQSFGSGNWDFYLVKTDADGNELWSRTYGGYALDFAYYAQQTDDDGYMVAGYTTSYGAGAGDFYLVKTDSEGNTLWTNTYGGSENDYCYSARQTADGGYILGGCTFSYGMGSNDYYLIKTDHGGDLEWSSAYGSTGTEECYDVSQTDDGGYIAAGFSAPYGNGSQRAWLVKTDSLGDTLWTRPYDGHGYDYAMSVQQTYDGGYIAAGRTTSFGALGYDFYLIRTDSSGDSLWTRIYGGSGTDHGYAVSQTSDGGYIVAGYTTSYGAGDWDFYLVRTDALGDSLWTATYGGYSTDECRSVRQTADGGFIAAGNSGSFGVGSRDFYVVRLEPEGSVSPLSLTLTPADPPVQIPPGGGSFIFDVEIVNYGYETYAVDIWIDISLPGDVNYPIFTREGIKLKGKSMLLREDLEQYVPGTVLAGEYAYNGYLRDHDTWELLTQDSFPFEKLPGNE